MIKLGANVAVLHLDGPQPLGVFETPVTRDRKVYCTVRSVSYRQRYEAMAHDLDPVCIIHLAAPEEYQGEHRATIGGETYRISDPYLSGDGLELTLYREVTP